MKLLPILFFSSFLSVSLTNQNIAINSNGALSLPKLQLQVFLRDTLPQTINKQSVPISTKEAKKILRKVKRNKAYLIDVRTPEEFATKHLQYAQNINYKSKNFVENMNGLNQRKPIYLYCRSGHRSGIAVDTLKTLGYQLVYSIGALDSLSKVGLPIEKK